MQPKFKNIQEYQKAELLMQPIFIRVLDNVRQQSESSSWETSYQEINEPFPSYLLLLKKDQQIIEYNIWELCFQICFKSYQQNQANPVETDSNLINQLGEVDWQALELKTKKVIATIFK
jgi:hypothetical protein